MKTSILSPFNAAKATFALNEALNRKRGLAIQTSSKNHYRSVLFLALTLVQFLGSTSRKNTGMNR